MDQAVVMESQESADAALALLVDRMRIASEAVAIARMRARARGGAEALKAAEDLQRAHELLEHAFGGLREVATRTPRDGAAAPGPSSRTRVRASRERPRPRVRLGGYRVMLVDSDGRARRQHADALERAGAEVSRIGSAAEALVRVSSWRPDVIVSALAMPEVDGCDFLRRLRRLPAERGGNVAAVAVISSSCIEDGRQALLAGYSFHVRTPADETTLARAVAKAFDYGTVMVRGQ